MIEQKRTQLLRPCLVSTALLSCALTSSCASSAPVSMPSYSAILRAEVAKQRADDCAQLKPHILPISVQRAVRALPPKAEGEGDDAYRARLTSEQAALLDWFNDDVAEAANHESYCG